MLRVLCFTENKSQYH